MPLLFALHLHTLLVFTLVYLIFVAAHVHLIAFAPHTVHNFEFKVALYACTEMKKKASQMKP